MSQKSPITRVGNLQQFWRQLSINVKLLVPIAAGLVVALFVIIAITWTPIDRLVNSTTQELFDRNIEHAKSEVTSNLQKITDELGHIARSNSLQDYVNAYNGGDADKIGSTQTALGYDVSNEISKVPIPFNSIRFVRADGRQALVVNAQESNGTVIGTIRLNSLTSEAREPFFQKVRSANPGQTFVSPASAVKNAAKPSVLLDVAYPIFIDGVFSGAVIGTVRFESYLNALVNELTTEGSYQLVLVEKQGSTLLLSDRESNPVGAILGDVAATSVTIPPALLNNTNTSLITLDDRVYRVEPVSKSADGVATNWYLVLSQSQSSIFAEVNNIKASLVLALLALFAVVGVVIFLASRNLTRPLVTLSQAASRIASGDVSVSVASNTEDEVGQLAGAFNLMTQRLSDVFTNMESRVTERTRNLEIASEISRDATQIRDIDVLLQRTVNAIRDRFNFYHAQFFLLDEAREYAVLITSTGEAGQILLGRKHKLAVGSDSVVGQVTAKGRTFITLDTENSDVPHRFNPVLPKTRSEMALPLRVGGIVVGALDIQSVEPNAFTENDVQIFQVLADQIAIAIDNARLLRESASRLRQVDQLNRQLTRDAWGEFIADTGSEGLGYQYNLMDVRPITGEPSTNSVSTDIKVRGETIGSLSVEPPKDRQLSPDEEALLQAVAERVSLAVENARLVEQTQNALTRIEQLYNASRTLGTAGTLDGIFTITADQLQQFDFIDRIVVLTAQPDPIPNAQYYEVGYVWERDEAAATLFEKGRRTPSEAVWYQSGGAVVRTPRVTELSENSYNEGLGKDLYNAGVRSTVTAPLVTNERWFGLLIAYSTRTGIFRETFVQFMSAIADQVAVAVENQFLLTNVQEEARRSRALAEAAQVSSQIGIDFETGIDNLFKAVAGPADYDRWWFGQQQIVNGTPVLVRINSHFSEGSPLHHMAKINLESEQNTIAEATRLGEWVLVNDPTDHHALSTLSRDKARAFGKHIAVPVRTGDRIVGTLMLGRSLTDADLEDRDVQLAITLTSQIAVVLENQRLFATAETERQTLQAVINSLPTGVLVIDAATDNIILTNELARELLGLDEDEPFERVHAANGETYGEDEFPPLRVLRTSKSVFAEDMAILKPDGDRLELLVNAAPIFDQNGQIVSAVAVFQDVTELRELENVLQESLRETTSLYETSRAIAAETDLPRILGVVANQILSAVIPDHLLTLFRDTEGHINQIFSVSEDGNVEQLEGDIPLPLSIFQESETMVEAHVADDPDLADEPTIAKLGVRSMGIFPLNVRNSISGWLFVGFNDDRTFTAEERRFLGTLADQAAIASENARLTKQTQEALNETRLLYDANYKINRAATIEESLQIMRDQLRFFAPTQIDVFLQITRRDSSTTEWVMHWNAAEPDSPDSINLVDAPAMDDADLLDSEPYFISNINTAPDEIAILMNRLPQYDGFTAQASVPMGVATTSTGRLVVSFNRPYDFGRLERQFITTMADQAAIVISNSMLVKQTQDSLEETGTLYQTSGEITNAETLSQVLDAIINHATPPNANRAMIIQLLGSSWDASDAAIEMAASWDHELNMDMTGIRFTPDQYPAWDEISSPELFWCEDISADERMSEASRNVHQSMGVVSVVSVPLSVGGKPLGALVFSATERWPQTDREVRIYTALADQVAIYMENKNLLAQTERRARQLQTSAQIAQAATSILNLDELFNSTVNLIKESFSYDHAQIFLITPDRTDAQLVASTGEAGKQLLGIRHHLFVGSQSVIGQVTLTGIPTIVSDTADPRSVHKPNAYLPQTRAEMALALTARGEILGALDVQSNRPGAFTPEDQEVLQNLANQIAVAIANARLFELTTKREDEQRFLFDVTRAATGAGQELAQVAHRIADMIRARLGSPETSILLLDEEGTQLNQYTSLADETLSDPVESYPVNAPVFAKVIQTRQPEVVSRNNSAATAALRPWPNVNTVALSPMYSGDNFVGLIMASDPASGSFDEDALELLETLSNSLAAAIQNARLLSEVQLANARLREVDKLKSQFLANMSHELRTPLNSIIGFSRVILKGIDGPLTQMQEQDLSTIHESGKHLLNLVNDILDQAKIEAGKMELSFGFFSVPELVKSVMSTAIGLVKDKPVRLHQEIEPNLPNVWGDEFRSRQVLLNLVSNAAKFTAQGSVTVSAFKVVEDDKPFIQISVTDTGIGIPEDKLGAVFEAFQQAENTTARQYEGTGLGLPIAKSLIEMQGGTISVLSELNVGSTFSVTLPINQPDPEPVESTENDVDAPPVDSQLASQVAAVVEQAEAPKPQQRIILAIDDEVGMINLYRRYLARSGYEIIGGKPEEAEELAINYQPRIILLDINMPGLTGWDILARLKDIDETYQIPVIVCSIENEKERAYRLGAADYLIKSIDERTLIEAVKRVELERDRRRVLIIDDQPESIRLVRDAIAADERFSVLEAVGGEQGVDVATNHRPDLIILDLRMPEMDGFEVFAKLRSESDTANIPVLVVTADDLTEDERKKLDGATVYQKQSLDVADLLNVVTAQITW